MRVLGTRARACIRWRHRPPVPIRPMWIVSLAPAGWAEAGSASADVAAVAAVVFRNERRDRADRAQIAPGQGDRERAAGNDVPQGSSLESTYGNVPIIPLRRTAAIVFCRPCRKLRPLVLSAVKSDRAQPLPPAPSPQRRGGARPLCSPSP